MFGDTLLRILFFLLSNIDKRDVIAEADMLSDTKSVVEMFSIPVQRQYPPQQPPLLPQQPPLPSISTKRMCSSSTEDHVHNSPRRQIPIGPFVHTTNGRTGIRSANHTAGLIAIIQLAGAHPTGSIGTFGHNNRTNWFQENIDALFQSDGPLGMFNLISLLVLARCFSLASIQAREIYDWNHSADQSSAAHEDVPPWAEKFFLLFEAQQNMPVSASAQAAEIRSERRSVASALTGRQAPLGNHSG